MPKHFDPPQTVILNQFEADQLDESTTDAGVTVDGLLIKDGDVLIDTGGKVDLNGVTDSFILDADADTSLDAPTDDQIDIKISGADDFKFTADTFTALSGSVIKTDTIQETTGAAGVTIDSLLIKDGVAYSPTPNGAVSGDGAITIPTYNKDFFITKAGVAAMTIADPTAGTHDGVELTFIATTANAHTLNNSAGSGFFSSGGSSKDVATFGGAIGDRITIVAYQGKWYIKDSLNITLG
jgi:hypothetical protein